MSTMVERVAKAIDAANHARVHDEALGLTYLDIARSAISAMREPTDAMDIAAGVGMGGEHIDYEGIWRRMIDEALK